MTSGLVLDTSPVRQGGTLTTDTASGDTVLLLDDAGDFDEEFDQLRYLVIGDETTPRRYVAAANDEEAQQSVTLSTTVGATFSAGEFVAPWDTASSAVDKRGVDHVAWVRLDESEDPVPATIPHDLVPSAGVSLLVGANVRIEQADDEEWYVAEVLGREAVVDADTILTPYLTAYLPANVSIPSGTMTTISWGNNIRSARAVPGASFNSYIVVPRSGIYVVTANVVFEPNGSGTRYVQIVVANPDGSGERVERNSMNGAASVGSTSVLSVKPMPLFEGERVIMQVQQNSGGALNAVGGLAYTALELTWIAAR